MAIRGRFKQGVLDAGFGTIERILRDANLLRDLVGRLKADPLNVCRQSVGIAAHLLDGMFPVSFVDAYRPTGADAIAVQENHNLADLLRLLPCMAIRFRRFGPMPSTYSSSDGRLSMMSKTSAPKCPTSFFARIGPMPLTKPLPRYFSIPSLVVGGTAAGESPGTAVRILVLNPTALGREPFPGADGRQ